MANDTPFEFDVFISYSTDPDYRFVRRLETFIESFHKTSTLLTTEELRPLNACIDGSDFRIPSGRRWQEWERTDAKTYDAVQATIEENLAKSTYLLLLDCGAKPFGTIYMQPLTTDEPMARMDDRTRWLLDRRLGHHPQTVGDHAPADPTFRSLWATILATIQPMAPFESADPVLDARAPVVATSEPALRLMGYPHGRFCPGLGQDHRLDAVQGGIPLVRGGIDASIPREQAGWMFERLQMMGQAWRHLGLLSRIALQHGVTASEGRLLLPAC